MCAGVAEWKTATGIVVERVFAQAPQGTVYASLVGAEQRWCASAVAPAELVRAAQAALTVTASGALGPAIVDDGSVPNRGLRFRFEARSPGDGDVRLASAGYARHVHVEVVEATDVVAAELIALSGTPSDLAPIDRDFLEGMSSSPAIVLEDAPYGASVLLIPRLTTRSGRRVLGGAHVSKVDSTNVELTTGSGWNADAPRRSRSHLRSGDVDDSGHGR